MNVTRMSGKESDLTFRFNTTIIPLPSENIISLYVPRKISLACQFVSPGLAKTDLPDLIFTDKSRQNAVGGSR